MRLSSIVLIAGVFLSAAVLSLVGARLAANVVEDSSREGVRAALQQAGLDWATVDADGLQVFLSGTAPSEAGRFKAVSQAAAVVDAARIIDQMQVQEVDDIAPPRFSMEILRNDSGVSLIGLVPAGMDRAGFVEAVRKAAGGASAADLLESADYPVPKTWAAATGYALRALKALKRSKISVDASHVSVTAMTDSPSEKAEVEAALSRRLPEGVRLSLDISAPRPVITPFSLRFVIDGEGKARFDVCAADTEKARARIITAARAAGLEGEANCILALGVPSPKWAEAVEKAIAALADLGGGKVTFSDADITLIALQGTAQKRFDNVIGGLETDLPEVFALHAVLPAPPVQTTPETPEFIATLSPEGLVQLRGRVGGATERKLVDSFARAQFTSEGVDMNARTSDDLPKGWTLRVLAGLEALSHLKHGLLRVTPDTVSVRGTTGQKETGALISGLLSKQLGEDAQFDINLRYEKTLAPTASLPSPTECEKRVADIQKTEKITFEPGSARIDADGARIVRRIAKILRNCGELTMEIAGHTDSQGREEMNKQLSQQRAEAVLNELRMLRVLTASMKAVGYGETRPIADNDTEEGRAANRRIEFNVITPEETASAATEDADAQAATAQAPVAETRPQGDAPDAGNKAQPAAGTAAQKETAHGQD